MTWTLTPRPGRSYNLKEVVVVDRGFVGRMERAARSTPTYPLQLGRLRAGLCTLHVPTGPGRQRCRLEAPLGDRNLSIAAFLPACTPSGFWDIRKGALQEHTHSGPMAAGLCPWSVPPLSCSLSENHPGEWKGPSYSDAIAVSTAKSRAVDSFWFRDWRGERRGAIA